MVHRTATSQSAGNGIVRPVVEQGAACDEFRAAVQGFGFVVSQRRHAQFRYLTLRCTRMNTRLTLAPTPCRPLHGQRHSWCTAAHPPCPASVSERDCTKVQRNLDPGIPLTRVYLGPRFPREPRFSQLSHASDFANIAGHPENKSSLPSDPDAVQISSPTHHAHLRHAHIHAAGMGWRL